MFIFLGSSLKKKNLNFSLVLNLQEQTLIRMTNLGLGPNLEGFIEAKLLVLKVTLGNGTEMLSDMNTLRSAIRYFLLDKSFLFFFCHFF